MNQSNFGYTGNENEFRSDAPTTVEPGLKEEIADFVRREGKPLAKFLAIGAAAIGVYVKVKQKISSKKRIAKALKRVGRRLR